MAEPPRILIGALLVWAAALLATAAPAAQTVLGSVQDFYPGPGGGRHGDLVVSHGVSE